jgi:hypothetical protein
MNYIIDQNHIFHNAIIDYCRLLGNERYNKIEYLEKNFKKYNSYLIGGSRIGVIRPEAVNKYIDSSSFYNLFTDVCRLNESELLVKYISENYSVKNIILQLSLYDIDTSTTRLPFHYKITGESKFSFFLKYLLAFDVPVKIEYLKLLLKNKHSLSLQPTNCDGTWDYQQLEDSIASFKTQYYANPLKFPLRKKRYGMLTELNSKMKHLAAVVDICNKRNIRLIVCFLPENHILLDLYQVNSYLKFIKAVSQVTDFWNFSGYNTITVDNYNYYEMIHFRSFIGDMMMARIFNDTSVKVPDDFGHYVTKANADEHIAYLRENIAEWDNRGKVSCLNKVNPQ